jgi:hypothetical protein
MIPILIISAAALLAGPQTKTDPWHLQLEEQARATLNPRSADFPQGSREIICNPVEELKTDGTFREAVIECMESTTCGPTGTLFLYRSDMTSNGNTKSSALQFSEPTSGYMGGYYELVDLDNDGYPEVITVSGTDGVAPSQIVIRYRSENSWKTADVKEQCGGFCSAHDYLLMKETHAPGRSLISVKGCELERGNEKPCTPGFARISLSRDGKVQVAQMHPGNDKTFNDTIDAVVAAVRSPDRKEPERDDQTLRILGEVYDLAGLKRPSAIVRPADSDL